MTDDFSGQQRLSLKDIGADEYSSEPTLRKPITANDVGPYADDNPTSLETSSIINLNPSSFISFQNYPNPFNPATTIGFVLQEKSNAKLTIFNWIGEEIAVLVNEDQDKGYYKAEFSAEGGSASNGNGFNLASGIYFYSLQAGPFFETRKMILLK